MPKTVLTPFLLLLLLNSICAQTRYIPLRISDDIVFDGKLNDPCWQLALPMTDFVQTDPVPGAASTEKTDVRIVYNNDYLCVGFHCYDSMPSKIVKFLMDRDFSLGQDDGISVQLDTYNDKSTAVVFVTNPLSGRFDSEISNNGDNMNNDYNNFWDVISVLDSTGYTCELKIPFSSLRFVQKEKTVMGFRFARLIKRKNELCTYPKCDSSITNQWNNVSQEAELEFDNLITKKPIYVTPFIIGNWDQENKLNSTETAYDKSNSYFSRHHYAKNETLDKILSNMGVDVKYGLSKNYTVNLTVNTDFAQAEVDNRIINLSKYAVNLPEKRNFFLESKNYLSYSVGYGTQLFNSRTIGLQDDYVVPIIAGVRLTGKQNGWAVGFLNMQTTDMITEKIPAQNFTVARLRKFYGDKGSFWGGIVTNRISVKNKSVSNQSVALDAVHHFNDKWFAGFGTAATYDPMVNTAFDQNSFLNLFAAKSVNEGYSHSLDLELVGEKFNPSMGFNPETDYGFISVSNGKRSRIKGTHAINYWAINTQIEYRRKIQSKLTETKFGNIIASILWKKGSALDVTPIAYKEDRLFSTWELNNHITIPEGYYHMTTSDVNFYYDESKSFTANIFISHGDFYGGVITSLNPSAKYIINRFFRFAITYEYNQINFPESFSDNGESVYKSNLLAVNLTLTQSSKFSIKLLAQYDDQSKSFGGNLRIRYNPREGTDLYIVYNSLMNVNRLEAKPTLPLIDQQAIVVKYSVTFGL